jgi:hypothetical protein
LPRSDHLRVDPVVFRVRADNLDSSVLQFIQQLRMPIQESKKIGHGR